MTALLVGISRVRAARIRQVKNQVHLCGGQRNGRRGDPNIPRRDAFAMGLNQCAGVAGVGLQVQHPVGVGIQHRVGTHLLKAGQPDHRAITRRHLEFALGGGQLRVGKKRECGHGWPAGRWGIKSALSPRRYWGFSYCFGSIVLGAAAALLGRLLRGSQVGVDLGFHPARHIHLGRIDLKPAAPGLVVWPAHKGGAAHIGDRLYRLARGQPVRNLHNRPLSVAVQQQIALGVYHDRAAHLVGPVVVMRNAAQRTLNAAQHDRHVLEGLAAALAVDNGCPVGPLPAHVTRGIGVVTADLAVGGVAVDHGVHVARRHAPEQVGLAQRLEGLGALPVWLGNDAHPETLHFEHAPDHRHAKAGVVHIGIARDQHDVTTVPAQFVHLGPAHRQERRCTKACSPVLAVARQRFSGAREKRDVNRGVHGHFRVSPRVYGLSIKWPPHAT